MKTWTHEQQICAHVLYQDISVKLYKSDAHVSNRKEQP